MSIESSSSLFQESRTRSYNLADRTYSSINSNNRFKPYSVKKTRSNENEKDKSGFFYNATLAKLLSISENFKTFFSGFLNKPKPVDQVEILKYNPKSSSKRVHFDIKPGFLNQENCEYADESYFFCSSSSSSSSLSNITNSFGSILKNSDKSQEKWTCSKCFVKHKISVEKCTLCGTSDKIESLKQNKTSDQTSMLKLLDANSKQIFPKTWNCKICYYVNDFMSMLCKSCYTLRDKQSFTNEEQINMKGSLYEAAEKRRTRKAIMKSFSLDKENFDPEVRLSLSKPKENSKLSTPTKPSFLK